MNYYSIKTKNPDMVTVIQNNDIFNIEQLNRYFDDIEADDLVFIQFGGSEGVAWDRGLVGITKVVERPDHQLYTKNNFVLNLEMVLRFPFVLERKEFKFYFDAYDASEIGPMTKGEGNQALRKLTEDQVCAVMRIVAEANPQLSPNIRGLLPLDLGEIVFGPMMRIFEKEVTYDQALEIVRTHYLNYANRDVRSAYKEYVEANLNQRKDIFARWLSRQYIPQGRPHGGNQYSEGVREAYVGALERKARDLNGLSCRSKNLYAYTDLIEFLSVRERIIECPNYATVNASVINNGFSPALSRYCEFLLSIYFGNPAEIKKRKTCRDIELHERERTTHSLNVILYGPPGTGKTYSTVNYALAIVHNEPVDFGNNDPEIRTRAIKEFNALMDDGQIVFTTFHQNYGYEEFIQGLRPDLKSETMKLHLQDGVFKRISDRALNNPEKDFVIILDEINRANISKVFGELITLIEEDKRWGEPNQMWLTLQSGEVFSVPNNLYIIGTMNSADKSISLIDAALRRRFEFLEIKPRAELISDESLQNILARLNEHLAEELNSSDLLVGHSYFIGKTITDLPKILNNKVIPLLYEYFYDQREKVETAISEALTGYNVVYEDGNTGRLRVETIT